MLEFKILLLIIIANGAPVILRKLLGSRFAWPLDGNIRLPDNRPLFGPSKTWRGVIAAILFTVLAALLLGFSAKIGAIIGITAMLGDLLSSFLKRRLNIEPSGMALGLDQIPEALLPLLALSSEFELDASRVFALAGIFLLLDLTLSPILYKLRIRKRPY